MERSFVPRRLRVLATAAALLSTHLPTAHAALLAHFDFEDAGGSFSNVAEDVAANLAVGAWRDADGTVQSVSNAPGFALSSRSYHDGNRLLLSLTPATGFRLQLDGLHFDHRATSTGPTTWQLNLADTVLASGSATTTFTTEQLGWTTRVFDGPVEFALSGAGATSAAGTWRIDNVTLHGSLQAVSAVPVPAAGWLFGGSLLALWRRGRRKHAVAL